MKFTLTDVRLERFVIGKIALQMKFTSETGHEFTYQQPFDLTESIDKTQYELMELAKGIHKTSKEIEEHNK